MYKCLECGHIFEDGEEKKKKELIGEFWGAPAYETTIVCPHCGGNFEPTKQCLLCKSEHLDEELCGGICFECIEDKKNDINTCYALGATCEEEIKLNSFLLAMFSKSEIEALLFNYLKVKEKKMPIDCSEFIKNDLSWFCHNLLYL